MIRRTICLIAGAGSMLFSFGQRDSVSVVQPKLTNEGIEALPTLGTRDDLEQYAHGLEGSHWALSPKPRHFFSLEASGLYDASTIYNDLVVGLYKGQFLDRDLRERSLNAMNGNNRFGYELSARASYSWGDTLFGNGNMRPRISFSYQSLGGMRFADELFDVSFFGNASYEGRTAHLGPSALEQITYRTIGFGFEDKASRSFFEIQLVNGATLNRADIDRADLMTGNDGRFLRLDLDGSYARSDTGANHTLGNGMGAAIAFEVRKMFSIGEHNATFSFSARDLGFIAWNDRSLRVPKDSTIRYEGIRVVDILDLGNTLIGSQTLQDTLGLNYQAGAFLRPLPACIRASFRLFSADLSWNYELSLDQRALPGYEPHAAFIVQHIIDPRWARLQAEASYGGFGGPRFGLGAECYFTRDLKVGLRSPNIVGLVSNEARGKAVMLSVERSW